MNEKERLKEIRRVSDLIAHVLITSKLWNSDRISILEMLKMDIIINENIIDIEQKGALINTSENKSDIIKELKKLIKE